MTAISDAAWAELVRRRTYEPHRIAPAYADRRAPSSWFNEAGNLFLVAADHPGRGALAIGANPMAMADRRRLLDRLVTALAHPDVNGVLGSPDIVEELLLLGALDGKVVIGSMNRGGLDGAVWTMDDRFTGYDAAAIARCGLQGGKCCCGSTTPTRGRADPAGLRRGGVGAGRPGLDGHGRTLAVHARFRRVTTAAQRSRGAGPGGYRGLGARHLECLHLAEDARV